MDKREKEGTHKHVSHFSLTSLSAMLVAEGLKHQKRGTHK
jgi:hypothetical protein